MVLLLLLIYYKSMPRLSIFIEIKISAIFGCVLSASGGEGNETVGGNDRQEE
jgi:hypothetical protein